MISRRTTSLVLAAVAAAMSVDAYQPAAPQPAAFDAARATPLEIARVLATRYPERPMMSYIPAVAWSASLRLAELTGEADWKDKPRRDMQPFLAGERESIAPPYQLTSLAGHFAFADLGARDGNPKALALASQAAAFILGDAADAPVKFARQWTDDMFMASALLARVAARDAANASRHAAVVGRLLTGYAQTLQRADGLFIHAKDGPHAWGRGNGFALLGMTEALTYLPESWPDRSRVLEIYRKQIDGLLAHQSDDGSWRQVVDEPASYRELTVTAMTVTAMARGVRLGWLPASARPAIQSGWRAVAARVNRDGTVRDVCSGTGAGPTKEYYLNRPVVNGADDRGGAMALLAAVEVEELSRQR